MKNLKNKALFAFTSLYFLTPAVNFNNLLDFNILQNLLISSVSLFILISLILFKFDIILLIHNKPLIICIFIFLFVQFSSALLNNSLILFGKSFSFYLNLILFYIIISNFRSLLSEESMSRFTGFSILIGGTVVVLMGYLQILGINIFNFINYNRPGSSLSNRTFAAEYLACVYPFLLWYYYISIRNNKRLFLIIYSILLIIFSSYIFLLRTRAAYISIAISIFIFSIMLFIYRKDKIKSNSAYVFLLVIIIFFSFFIAEQSFFNKDPKRTNLNENISSIFNADKNIVRLNYWKTSLNMFSEKPIVGIGTGMWFGKYPEFLGLENHLNSLAVNDENVYYNSDLNPHNIYLEILSENGVIGLLAFFLIIIPIFYKLLRLSFKKDNYIPYFLCLISFLVLSFFTFTKENSCVMILVFLSFAVAIPVEKSGNENIHVFSRKLMTFLIFIISVSLFLFHFSRYNSEKRYISALNYKARVDYINMNIELDKINNCIYPIDVNKMPVDYYRGVGYYEQKDFNKSIVLFKNAIKMAPGIATIKNNLAAAYYQTGNIDSAKFMFNDLINNYPNYIEPQINMLSLYTNLKNYDSAKVILHDIEEKEYRKENVKNYSILLSIKEFLK
jgi:O-antigen ligase